jgi:NDP-sugar pyrophosphorylase family protein
VGYQGDTIRDHFGPEAFGLQVLYSQESSPLGTGGALRNAANLIESNTALVMNGDSYTDADLHRFELHHDQSGADMSVVVVTPDGREDCGFVSMDASGKLLAFQEKQVHAAPKYINAGVYLLSREILLEIPVDMETSLEKELLPRWLEQGKHIRATIDPATCHDIGTPERLRRAQTALAEVETGHCPTASGVGL